MRQDPGRAGLIVAAPKGPPVKLKCRAHDGGSIDGSMDRPRAVAMIYYMMSPEERIKVRNQLAECDARIAEDETEKANG